MNMQPKCFMYHYEVEGGHEIVSHTPLNGVPSKVDHLYSADQMAMAQESVKIEAALIIKGVINGDIYADRIRKIEILK